MSKPARKISKDWEALNNTLRYADEEDCERLYKEEKQGANRMAYLQRIQARFRKARKLRELQEFIDREDD